MPKAFQWFVMNHLQSVLATNGSNVFLSVSKTSRGGQLPPPIRFGFGKDCFVFVANIFERKRNVSRRSQSVTNRGKQRIQVTKINKGIRRHNQIDGLLVANDFGHVPHNPLVVQFRSQLFCLVQNGLAEIDSDQMRTHVAKLFSHQPCAASGIEYHIEDFAGCFDVHTNSFHAPIKGPPQSFVSIVPQIFDERALKVLRIIVKKIFHVFVAGLFHGRIRRQTGQHVLGILVASVVFNRLRKGVGSHFLARDLRVAVDHGAFPIRIVAQTQSHAVLEL
mmetsp:Transcript_12713/g.26266  ORF Transcript_12713/g.26266 Transcript_12713/m.26266 type:complete len:277 (-) Transcript_12713:322-1152(-)